MTVPTQDRKHRPARETINLRASREDKVLIDHAAALLGKSRTEFMLESARRAAEDALLDRRLFLLGRAQYEDFVARLDAPPDAPEALRRLMTAPTPWDR